MADVEQSLNNLAQQFRDELRGMWRFRWKAMAVAWGMLLVGTGLIGLNGYALLRVLVPGFAPVI